MGRCIFQKRYLDEQDRYSAKGRVNRISYAYDRGGRLCRVTDSTVAVSEYTYNSRGQRTVVRNKIREDVWHVALKQHIWQEMYTYMELLLMEETKCQKEVIHLEWMIMVI